MKINHGVSGKSDPNFKPDPSKHHVWDAKKCCYRLVDKPVRVVAQKKRSKT